MKWKTTVLAAFCACAAANGGLMAAYNFDNAWKEVAALGGKRLPQSVTNKVEEILREAVAAKRWPDAARAFLVREHAAKEFADEVPEDAFPAFAAAIDAQPAPLQAVLQLHLAHVYDDNVWRPWLWGGAKPTKLDDEAAAEKMPPWSPEKINATLEAQFAKVFAYEAELKKQPLSDWKAIFDEGTAPKSYCPTLFDFAVRDAISFYGSRIPDETLSKGLALYNKLIAFHREDGNMEALAMAELEAAEYIHSFDEKPEKASDAAFDAALDELLARYDGKTDVAALVASKKAERISERGDLVSARELAAKYAAKYPKSPGGKECANIVAEIEEKRLSCETERNWCAPWPETAVKAKNVSEVYFRLVPVSFAELVEDRSMGEFSGRTSDAMKNKYLTRKPAKEWKKSLPLKQDYTEQTFKCPVPEGLPSGHYVLYAAANDKFGADKLPLYAQHVTVTSLALVMETGNVSFGGTVYRAESGTPVEGATVELWWYGLRGGRFMQLREKLVTDAFGRFALNVPKDADRPIQRHVRVVMGGDEVLSLKSEGSGYPCEEDTVLDHIDLFTDRALYRPGQEIKVKGIAYHADPATREFHTLENYGIRLKLLDPNDKEVASKTLRTNKWGSFADALAAPVGRLTGSYTVVAQVVLAFGDVVETKKPVNVEEYKRPKFSAKFEKSSAAATLGEPMTVTGKAMTYSGLPVRDAKVSWRVSRTTNYPDWWSWFGGKSDDDGEGFVANGDAKTDENGAFTLTFTPVASPKADLAGDPSFTFEVTADVTDGTGEEHAASESFEVGTVAWRTSVWVEGKWHASGKPVQAKVRVRSLAGEPVAAKGTLKAFRLKAPEKTIRKPADARRYDYGSKKEKGPWDWKNWEVGDEVLSVAVDGSAASTPPDGRAVSMKPPEKWTGELNLGVGAYRLVFETTDPNGKTVKDIASIVVFDPSANGLGLPIPNFFRVENTSVKVGDTLCAYWGTGYASGCCRVKVTSNRKVIVDEMVGGMGNGEQGTGNRERGTGNAATAPVWLYELPIKDEHRGELRIETTFVRENRIYLEHDTINIPWDNKYLDIKAEHITSKLVPGTEETWKFKVSGPAEVLAFMYDKSLDAYKWHDVTLNFSRYFTPWTRWLGTPQLQNAVGGMGRVAGSFPSAEQGGAYIEWPDWRDAYELQAGRRIGSNASCEMKCCAAVGSGAVAEDCVAAAPAARAPSLEGAGPSTFGSEADRKPSFNAPPRKNLQETAFFLPNLETDADGNLSFTFTAPDALTGWKFLMVAHDNALDGGIFRSEEALKEGIVTQKPLMCEPAAPRFVREGDDFLFAVKVTNTGDEPQSGVVKLNVEELKGFATAERAPTSQPLNLSTSQPFNLSTFQPFNLLPHESKVFEFALAIPDGCGYLKYVAKAKGEKFSDGEEGVLPVLSRRVMVREAVQLNARGKATKSFRLENLVASKGSETIRSQDLTVRAVSRPAWYAVLSLPYLMEFPHECCEQTFSRYYANALGEFIAKSDPRIRKTFDAWKAAGGDVLKSPLEANPELKAIALESTPWVREAEHEGAARVRLGELFGEDRLASEQERCLAKLFASRNGDGLWPWFPGGPSSSGITLYILTGFARLSHLADIKRPDFFDESAVALDAKVSEGVKWRLRSENLPFHVDGFDVRWLYLHSFNGVHEAGDETLVPLFVKHIKEEWTSLGLESQALAAIALKRMGEEAVAEEIMASIKERAVVSEELGMYWKRPYFFSCSVFAAPVSTQAVVVEAFREVTGDEESADACNVWLLKQKQTQDWTSTAATADAVYALMLGGGTDLLAGDALAEVSLGGEKVVPDSADAGTGMWSVRYAADRIRPEMGEIAFTGAGEKGVSWGGVHWTYFEDVLKVREHEPKELRVEKKYYKKTNGPDGARLVKIEGRLEPGDEIVARLEVKSDRTYEFVHLSDERPACAEPADVLSAYRWRDGVGYYQSTRDTATHYYIDRLNKGTFVIETSYRVRQRGVFVGGLATIQCMYAPEFTAHSSAETVRVSR